MVPNLAYWDYFKLKVICRDKIFINLSHFLTFSIDFIKKKLKYDNLKKNSIENNKLKKA